MKTNYHTHTYRCGHAVKCLDEEAKQYFVKASKRFEVLSEKDPHCAYNYAACCEKIATILYYSQKMPDEAIMYLTKARPYCFDVVEGEKVISIPLLSRISETLSDIYISRKNYVNAEKYLLESIELIKETIRFTQADPDNEDYSFVYGRLTSSLKNIAEIYINQNNL